MIKSERILHELKTERDVITKPLPPVMGLVPVLFYLSVICAIGLNVSFFIKNKEIEALTAEWTKKAELENIEKVKTEEQIQLIRNEDLKAEEIYKWVQGSKQIQPLALSIARSMGQKSSIEELLLYREEKTPHQIRIQLKFQKNIFSFI